jgi:hypothetical protein
MAEEFSNLKKYFVLLLAPNGELCICGISCAVLKNPYRQQRIATGGVMLYRC